jgi:hypothetical protein
MSDLGHELEHDINRPRAYGWPNEFPANSTRG